MTKRLQIISYKEFTAAALNANKEFLIVHVVFLDLRFKISIHPAWAAQIALLIAERIAIPIEYLNFADIFSKNSITKLLKYFNINKHAINQEPGK